MPASDHLNGQQFMPVSDLLHAQSNDARVYQEYHPEYGIKETTVQATYARRAENMAANRHLFQALDKPIRNGTIDPVVLQHDPATGESVVHEGHHRIVRAHQMGVPQLPVSFSEESQPHHDEWLDRQVDDSVNAYWGNR